MVYLDLVMGLNFIVDYLLMMGANRLCGFPLSTAKTVIAAAVGGLYGGVCLLPGFRFLGSVAWRLVFLVLIALIAFGWNRSAVQRGGLFVLLTMALGGIALGIGKGGVGSLIGGAAGISLLCILGFRDGVSMKKYCRVILSHDGRKLSLMALHDTGNMLRDPISGEPVLVVGSQIADELFGLTQEQLCSPVETIGTLRMLGLRLIPYRAVGQPGGMLLAIKLDKVIIDGRQMNTLVAFAPDVIENDGFQALAGGIL